MRLAIITVLLVGCGIAPTVGAPVAPTAANRDLYPHEIEYELLSQVSGEACASVDEAAMLDRSRSPDPAAVGPGALWERAKYDAIRSVAEADVLLFAVSKVLRKSDGGVCVTVAGRAARAQTVRAVGASVREDRRSLPAQTTIRKTRGEILVPAVE